jgi:multidrug efflux pump subunit AcrB
LTRFEKFRNRFLRFLDRLFPFQKLIVILYTIITCGLVAILFMNIGRDVLPKINGSQFQVRLRAPDGTRLERTEEKTIKAIHILEDLVGKENISVTSAFVGQHPGQFSTSPIYLFMSGPQEAVLQIALKENYKVKLDDLKESFRHRVRDSMPDVKLSFEPIELTDKVLSQGSPTPIEIRITGKNKKINEEYADKVIKNLNQVSYLRDIQLAQPIKYPTIDIDIDRTRAAQMGVSLNDISRSLVAATSSSRFTEKNLWIDPKSNVSYGVQVQIPENQMTSMNDINEIPVLSNESRPVIGDVADVKKDTTYGENDNLGALPFLSVTANINKKDLGTATKDVKAAIESLGELPRGLTIETKGMTEVLTETLSSLQSGLITAIAVIFLMLAANFQSFKVSLVVLSTLPAVLLGSLIILMLTGSTLNLQSYMGIIMSVGVSIANSVLLITNAEHLRLHTGNALNSAKESAALRMRPILMTSVAMVVGMLPMASGMGDGGDQAAPLGRAVVGGLIASTFAALFILPLVFSWVQNKSSTASVSLDPEDKESAHYIPELNHSGRSH